MPMTKTFTENELISQLYGETSSDRSQEFQSLIIRSQELQDVFLELRQIKDALDQLEINVPPALTEKILEKVSNLNAVSL